MESFSEDGKYFSFISNDGRLKIWDTESNVLKQEYTPDLHLSSPPTCLLWITGRSSSDTPKKGTKRKSSESNLNQLETPYVVLGTSRGQILVYSVAQAKVETTLVDKSTPQNIRVTSLDWLRKYGLFSCYKNSWVYEWDLQNSTVKNKYNLNADNLKQQGNSISAIKIVPHNQNSPGKFLVTASWQLKLWYLCGTEQILIKNMGHSNSPRTVLTIAHLTTHNKCYIVEGSRNERLLSFWDVTISPDNIPKNQINGDEVIPSKKQRRKSEVSTVVLPSYNFILEDAPKYVDILINDSENGTKVNLGAATRSGVVHYYGHMLNGVSTKPIKPSVTLHVTTEDAKPMPLQCCKFTKYSTEENSREMIIGYEATPGRILYERVNPDAQTKTQVLIRADPLEANKKLKQTDEANKLRTDDVNQKVTYVEPMGGISRKRSASGSKVEVPMEARLANLAIDTKSRGKSAVNQNLTKLLVQGLHSKDKLLILMVLQKDDPAVALRTVTALPTDYVPQLLEQLIDMATKKTSQCKAVCVWLGALLRCHSALLLATLNTATTGDKLSQLMSIMTQRRSHLCQLLNLKGRLDLTISQRSSQEQFDTENEPVLDYADTSSEEDIELDNQSGNESWDEAKFEESDSESEGSREAMSDSGGE